LSSVYHSRGELIAIQKPDIVANQVALPNSARRTALIILLGWLAMLGFDFFLHGGLLAGLYAQPDSFLLGPSQAFALIPLGYLSFLLLSGTLTWLMVRLRVLGGRAGALFGLKLGALVWGSFVLGLVSISTASLALLAGWFAGQVAELALAGYFVGSALAGGSLKRLFGNVIVLILLFVVVTIALQSLGIAPSVRVQ
jgi:hypothetical protein